MRYLDFFRNGVDALVHSSALGDPMRVARHRVFIAQRLATSLFALGFVPLYFAWRGAPTVFEVVTFVWAILPLVSVWLVSRTGELEQGLFITLGSLMGMIGTLAFIGGNALPVMLLWLAIAPIEPLLVNDRRIAASALALGALTFGLCALFIILSPNAGESKMADPTAFVAPAIVYALALALSTRYLHSAGAAVAIQGEIRLRLLSEAVGDLVLRHDRSGAVIEGSNAAGAFDGLEPARLIGRGLFERVHIADRPAYLRALGAALHGERAQSVVMRIQIGARPQSLLSPASVGHIASVQASSNVRSASGLPAQGEAGKRQPVYAWAELRCRGCEADAIAPPSLAWNDEARARRIAACDRTAVISVIRDVTHMKNRESELERANEEAAQATVWKDRFLANVSHELRTPLNAIIGFSEILASPALAPKDPAKQREYAHVIHESGQHLLSVVNSILDMSKIEAGSFEIVAEPFEIAPLVESVVDMVRLRAEQGDVTLSCKIDETLQELIGDKRACRQILINIVSNAVKFTPAGGKVSILAAPEGNSIVLMVCDTGIGINAADLPRLGHPFFQASSSYDRPYEGTGLGLSLVRGLVGLHGGAISIESAPQEGTRVTIRLPIDSRACDRAKGPAPIETLARRSPLLSMSEDEAFSKVRKSA